MPERGGSGGLIREGLLDRLLRKLLRPRVESPLEMPKVTVAGDYELRLAPLRIKWALYDQAANRLDVVIVGGRVALASGGADVADVTKQISAPAVSTTYWFWVDSAGAVQYGTAQPAAGNIEIGTVTTPAAWPASTSQQAPVATFSDLHGVSKVTGHTRVVLSERAQYRWSGSAWEKLAYVVDKRPWFVQPGKDKPGLAFYVGDALTVLATAGVITAPFAYTLVSPYLYANVDVAPQGAAIILDVLVNGTSIWTNPADRPTIAAGFTTATFGTPNTVNIAAGDRVKLKIEQVGSTTAGSDLSATLVAQ